MILEEEITRLRRELRSAQAPPKVKDLGFEPESFLRRQEEIVEQYLDQAEAALEPPGPLRRIRLWYSGAAIEEAWRCYHRASEALLLIQSPGSLASEFMDLQAAFLSNVPPGDPRRLEFSKVFDEARRLVMEQQTPSEVDAALRSNLLAARRAANVTSDTAHGTVRSWRNILMVSGLVLAALAISLAVVHAFVPSFLSLVPSKGTQRGDAVEPWAVELIGMVGGALAAVLALARFRGFTDPYGLPTAQALLRIPTSAVTALFGVLLMQTAALDLFSPRPDATTVLAFAFIFGYAQEPLLRMIDQKAGEVLNPARAKDEPG